MRTLTEPRVRTSAEGIKTFWALLPHETEAAAIREIEEVTDGAGRIKPAHCPEFSFTRLVWGFVNARKFNYGNRENHAADYCLRFIRYKLGGDIWTPYPNGYKIS